ncbi:MAG: monofunctional biosynthetic peptidoglycan transglycosylase [Betaproteobacteria bacterium]|nr:monofunctional biosynthetic peptidoglycan transglycosylase [Betaproteobacteria bacterium]
MLRALKIAWKAYCYALGTVALVVVAVQGWFYVHVWWWNSHDPSASAFMSSRLERLREKDPKASLRHAWVPYDGIAASLKRAVVAAEDAKFMGHEGFDLEGIQRALEKNDKKGRVVAGGSTISQQVAKNLFLSGERSWVRKGQEAVITWMLETTMSKRRILEIYLNVAEWGDGVFGAEAAAQYHFGVPAERLSATQAAYLAAVLPSPRRYDRGKVTPYVASRVETILARMDSAQIP